MGLLRILLGFVGLGAAVAQDAVGSAGCSASSCVLANPALRFGTGAENSVNAYGLFQQPWYYSQTANTWYKLTYANYPLDTAVGMGTGSTQWSGATVVDLYTQPPSAPTTDYSNFIVDSSDTTKSVGHGKIISSRAFTILGNPVTIQNTFSLGATDRFVKIVTQFTNNGVNAINNVIVWVGTRDDFVGTTDVNTKTRGNLDTGSFVAVTSNSQSSRAIMITNTNEGVLFYSETTGVMTAYSMCCSFANVYNTDPLSLPPQTPSPTDGSYAAVLPLGNIAPGSSASIVWYYAAGAVTSLSVVAESVAAAQVADASSSMTPASTPSVSPTTSPTPSVCPSWSSTSSPTASGTLTRTLTGTGTPSRTPSVSPSVTPSVSGTVTPSITPSTTYTAPATVSRTPSTSVTALPTGSQTPLAQAGVTILQLGNNFIPGIIVINVVTGAVIVGFVSVCACCAYGVFVYRQKNVKECVYCKKELKSEKLDDHLKGCEEYKMDHVKRSEVYNKMRRTWA